MLRDKLLEASRKHFAAHVQKHQVNIEVLLSAPIGVAEHPDLMETIEQELALMAEYHDKLEMLNIYFSN